MGNSFLEHSVFKGCPQGSCLRPVLWLIIAENLFSNFPVTDHVKLLAYADDFIIAIAAKNRRELEKLGNSILTIVSTWLKSHNLKISSTKCTATTFSSSTGPMKRLPSYKLDQSHIPNAKSFTYLGVIISQNLQWYLHLEKINLSLRMLHKNSLKFSRRLWGVDSDFLKLWYKTVIERIAVYAAGAWASNLNKTTNKKINSMQRPFLIQITKAYRTVSTDGLQVLAGIRPLDLQIKYEAIKNRVLHLRKEVKSEILESSLLIPDTYIKKQPSFSLPPFLKDFSFINSIEHSSYFKTHGLHAYYTDGSKTEEGVGAAWCLYQHNSKKAEGQTKLQPNNSNFQAELKAIDLAISHFQETNLVPSSLILFTDSLSSLSAIKVHRQQNSQVQKIQNKLLKLVNSKHKVLLSWVKAHDNNLGNEHADYLAKSAIKLPVTDYSIALPPSYLKKQLNSVILASWQENWKSSSKGRAIFNFIHDATDDILVPKFHITSLISNHGPFPTYLSKFVDQQLSEYCVCGEEGTSMHYLFHCPLTRHFGIKKPSITFSQEWTQKMLKNKVLNSKFQNLYNWLITNQTYITSSVY